MYVLLQHKHAAENKRMDTFCPEFRVDETIYEWTNVTMQTMIKIYEQMTEREISVGCVL